MNSFFKALKMIMYMVVTLAFVPAQASDLKIATAFYGKTVASVEVSGLKRIEKDAVLAKISLKPGQKISREAVRADISALFSMGYFDDIEFDAENAAAGHAKLMLILKERPVISKLEFEGNDRITTSDLQEVIKVKEWSILDLNKIKEDVQKIQKHYEEKGFYLAKVSFEVKKTKQADEVELVYKVNDYDKVRIKKITFLNNNKFSDEQLKATLMETREGGLLSFMTGAGNFKDSAFKTDLQRLTLWYLDHGYVKFRHENPVVTVSDDKKWLYITIYVEEGEQYSVGKYDFSGDLLFPKEELHEGLILRPGEIFSITKRNADIQKLTEKYEDLGYAFVNVVPKMLLNDEKRIVDTDYSFEKGNLVYFGEINITGNTKTHDKVIRRELRIHEGELYSGTKFRESRENVERLGYFAPGEVVFNKITPKGRSDILNVEITVKERSTGTITVGAGAGSVQGIFFMAQLSEINLLGRGQSLTFTTQIAASRESKTFNLGFTEPYTLDTRWTSGFDFFYVTQQIPNKYVTRKLGFDIRAGHPIIDYTNAYITYKNEGQRIDIAPRDAAKLDQVDLAADRGVLSSLIWQIVRDKRNNRFETTDGNYQSISLETAGIGPLSGDKHYYKTILNARYYKKVVGDLVFRTNWEYGQINPAAGFRSPPSERFFLGGPNDLKGFQLFSVGPYRLVPVEGSSTLFVKEPTGGLYKMIALFELEYPLIRDAGIKLVTFFDAGNTFAAFPHGSQFKIRHDWGFGIRWFSPIGPLRFEIGFPIDRAAGEDDSSFHFWIGPPF